MNDDDPGKHKTNSGSREKTKREAKEGEETFLLCNEDEHLKSLPHKR